MISETKFSYFNQMKISLNSFENQYSKKNRNKKQRYLSLNKKKLLVRQLYAFWLISLDFYSAI